VYERALAALPGSYKLWHGYLVHVSGGLSAPGGGGARAVSRVAAVYERALVFMHKMPVIWREYCGVLSRGPSLTRARRAFDRALQALPITQHEGVWPGYLAFARGSGVRALCVRVYRRYLQFDPAGREEYVGYLTAAGAVDEAAAQLAALVNDEAFVSRSGVSKHAHWMALCDLVSRHPEHVTSLRVDATLRSGIARFSDEVGRLWCALAEYYVRQGLFEMARDVYEEAMGQVRTVRDFATVFDAYAQFEEAMLTAKLELVAAAGGEEPAAAPAPAPAAAAPPAPAAAGLVAGAADLDDLAALAESTGDDVELRVARLELLMDRRPILLNSVLLRQNPHNVAEWVRRATLHAEAGASAARVVAVYAEAVATVDPALAVGKASALWEAFARYYERAGDLANARAVLRRGTATGRFRSSEELAALWCGWAEMEIRAGDAPAARALLAEAVAAPRGGGAGGDGVRRALHRSARLWALHLDLEESLGGVPDTKAAYERALALRVATPQMALNYAAYLEERRYFEDAFRAYEQGVAAFPWPHVRDIWAAYLGKFLERYGGSKLERARDLFEQALAGCPPAEAPLFYRLYAEAEERYGSVRHAMAVFDRATVAVAPADRYATYLAYIAKAEEHYGAARTRDIYARAVEALPDAQVKDMCLRFAAMEARLGEADRARAIYAHAATFCDPAVATTFWATWQDFEVAHGSEDSFRDMLRIKRSVAASFSTANAAVADVLAEHAQREQRGGGGAGHKRGGLADASAGGAAKRARADDDDGGAPAPAGDGGDGGDGDGGDDGDAGAREADVVEAAVPSAVFGGLSGAGDK
jgi:pre-mRNA-splicing factor SYF1